jgi:hypothetical protein
MESEQSLRAANAAAWEQFCEQLKEAGRILSRPETPVTELDRAEGLRYLARLTRLGLELCFEHADPDFPEFLQAWNATNKAGSDNPDNLYLNATVAGDREYRLRGHRGSAPRLRFSTFANRYATAGKLVQTGSLRAKDMVFAPDGTFEITVSLTPHPGNWLPLEPDSGLLTVRQNFSDRRHEQHATVTIERIDGPETPRLLTVKRSTWALKGALSFVARVTGRYAEWALWFQQRPNRVHIQEDTPFHEEGGDPRTRYLHGYWCVGADEALVMQTRVPECDMWNFQLSNYWTESLDYLHYPVCVNKDLAKYNPDGTVTLVIAETDPGIGNFLCTAGHRSGMMILRWTGAVECPLPECRVVKLDSLRSG